MAKRLAHGNLGRKKTRSTKAVVSKEGVLNGIPVTLNLSGLKALIGGASYQKIAKAASGNPWAMAVAGGVSAFFIGRFLYRYYENHPEISQFIQDNFETVESRLREFRDYTPLAH